MSDDEKKITDLCDIAISPEAMRTEIANKVLSNPYEFIEGKKLSLRNAFMPMAKRSLQC